MQLKEQPDVSIQNLWKLCGKNTEAGRIMYRYYGSHYKPQIKYPKVRTKTAEQLTEEKLRATKKSCPQKTKIEYPQKPAEYKPPPPVNSIPKRKPQTTIQKELEVAKRAPLVVPRPGQDRAALIDRLQEKYQFSAGILPKSVQATPIVFNEPKVKERKKLVRGQVIKENKTELEELDDLFESITVEIEDRQKHLEAVLKNGKNDEIEKRIKAEITSRISELQRIAELKAKVKNNP
eukprot:TRINITY_DN8448_c0_g1_i13.p1 TRINITY_DN8448_c0_g1~~TRINITY_DN8448_c0_g1_i13.p1  ORF type:complete len:235 (+),score=72.35 TRINITY_DN8448_c0_g1_i13:394-1098(+)